MLLVANVARQQLEVEDEVRVKEIQDTSVYLFDSRVEVESEKDAVLCFVMTRARAGLFLKSRLFVFWFLYTRLNFKV